jgi:hypothetical protein
MSDVKRFQVWRNDIDTLRSKHIAGDGWYEVVLASDLESLEAELAEARRIHKHWIGVVDDTRATLRKEIADYGILDAKYGIVLNERDALKAELAEAKLTIKKLDQQKEWAGSTIERLEDELAEAKAATLRSEAAWAENYRQQYVKIDALKAELEKAKNDQDAWFTAEAEFYGIPWNGDRVSSVLQLVAERDALRAALERIASLRHVTAATYIADEALRGAERAAEQPFDNSHDGRLCSKCGHSYAQHTKHGKPATYCAHCPCDSFLEPFPDEVTDQPPEEPT